MAYTKNYNVLTITITAVKFEFFNYKQTLVKYMEHIKTKYKKLPNVKFVFIKLPLFVPNFMKNQEKVLLNVPKCAVVCKLFPPLLRKHLSKWAYCSTTDVKFFKNDEDADVFLK